MPRDDTPMSVRGVPPGTLAMLILRVISAQPLHGYAIAQRIRLLSKEQLQSEEGSLYPALQKLLAKGWAKAAWTVSGTGRKVREYRITPAGRAHLEREMAEYRRTTTAVDSILERA